MQGLGAVSQPPMSAAPACLDGSSPAATQEVNAPAQIFPKHTPHTCNAPEARSAAYRHRCKGDEISTRDECQTATVLILLERVQY